MKKILLITLTVFLFNVNTFAYNPTKLEINNEIDRLACLYRVPAVILKAVCLQESNWEQYQSNGTAPLISADGGIGLMQVTLDTTIASHSIGQISELCYSGTQGQNRKKPAGGSNRLQRN